MEWDDPDDAAGQQLAIIDVPGGTPPTGGVLLVLSIEDYGVYLRTVADAQRNQFSRRQ